MHVKTAGGVCVCVSVRKSTCAFPVAHRFVCIHLLAQLRGLHATTVNQGSLPHWQTPENYSQLTFSSCALFALECIRVGWFGYIGAIPARSDNCPLPPSAMPLRPTTHLSSSMKIRRAFITLRFRCLLQKW